MSWVATMPRPVKRTAKPTVKVTEIKPVELAVEQPEPDRLREEPDEQTEKKKRKPADRVHRTVGAMNKVTR